MGEWLTLKGGGRLRSRKPGARQTAGRAEGGRGGHPGDFRRQSPHPRGHRPVRGRAGYLAIAPGGVRSRREGRRHESTISPE